MSEVLQLTSLCNRMSLPVLNQLQLVYVLTEIMPGALSSQQRMPLNFTLVLDRSGSMAGEKLETLKAAVKNIIQQLDPGDVISIVTFETRTQVLVPAQRALDKPALMRLVDKIEDGGGTNMASGLREGLTQVRQNLSPERISRIVLLTDGEATDKRDDSRQEADRAGTQGVPVIGLGFGDGWNEEFMFDLADRSLSAPGSQTGAVDYIPAPDQAVRIFDQVFQSMQIVAQDLQLTMRLVQGVEARKVWQVAPVIRDLGRGVLQGRSVVIPVPQLEKGGVAYLAELMVPPRPEGAVRIAQTDVSYTLPGSSPQREAVDLVLQFTSAPVGQGELNGRVMNIVEKVQAFKLQTRALEDADAGQVGSATQKLRQAVTILLSQGEADLAGQMAREADRLEQGGQMSSEAKKTIKLTSRKTVRLSE
jgi:Ca-activated chloride channel family protein